MRAAIFLLPLMLVACNRPADDSIEAVPPPSEEATNRLMSTAEQAAANAQFRMEQDGNAARSALEANVQGETR